MKKCLFTLFTLIILSNVTYSQKSLWKFINPEQVVLPDNESQWITPKRFATLDLDLKSFKQSIWNAPLEFTSKKGKLVTIPMPDGTEKQFEIFQSPCMQEGLSAKFPDIRSFAGINPKNQLEKIRLDISHLGVKCILDTEKGQVYIDPFARKQTRFYVSYFRADYERDPQEHPFVCGLDQFKDELTKDYTPFFEDKNSPIKTSQRADNLPLNKYRIAIAATALYSQYIGTTVADVIAELNTAVNRINQVLVKDLSVRFELVNDNDKVVFFDDANDGYVDGDLAQMIGWNTTVLAQNIGSANYDIGHVFGRSFAGGVVGLAQLGQVCRFAKGRAGSTLFVPKNDPFWIDIVAHEMGHQMGANHSFNNCGGQNENGGTAFEPGSGSTIMSYSGACGSNDVTNNSDAMYNVGALEEILTYMHASFGNECANQVDLGNHEPEVSIDIPNNFYIPISTPFELDCVAMDEDSDTLTYSWEQYDTGPLTPLGAPELNAPAFRVFAPQTPSKRVFPRMDRIVSNQSSITEVLPTYSREMSFQVVVRDNNYGGGATAMDKVNFKVTDQAGPFLVTYPNTFVTWPMTSNQTVTWDVANTDNSLVNCKFVNILLSVDGGFNYPYTLACNTPNDGSEDIVVPALPNNLTSARIRVQGANNIFFDISNQNFAISKPTNEALFFNTSNCFSKFCTPENLVVDIFLTPFGGYSQPVTLEINGLPSGATATFTKNPVLPTESAQINLSFDQTVLSGNYQFEIKGFAPGLDTFTRIVPMEIVSSTFGSYALQTPANGASGISKAPSFAWTPTSGAQSYEIEIATSPAFGSTIIEKKSGLTTNLYNLNNPLTESSLYFWRVRPVNECTVGEWSEINAFHTITLSCDNFKNLDGKKGISGNGTPTVTSKITILGNGAISDVSLSKIKGFHEYFDDLDVFLLSPAGTKVVLFEDQCSSFGSSFDFGLDDNASKAFTCPPTMGNVFKPKEPFSILQGEESAGEWLLNVKDDQISGGGELSEWTLKVCTSVSLNPPFLITNDTLRLKPLTGKKIDILHLETGDLNNKAEELTYTVVEIPQFGILGKGNVLLSVGDKFTQQDINDGIISYFNQDGNIVSDNFLFTVQDGEGGWIGILQFNVKPDDSILISTKDLIETPVLIYPNPAKDSWHISIIDNTASIERVEMFNYQGIKVQTYNNETILSNNLNTQNLASGVYFVNIITSRGNFTQKLIIQK